MANNVLPSNDVDVIVDRRKDDRVRKSLRYSVFDGAFSAAMVGFGESFFVAYALFLKATTLQVAFLSALPQALGSLLQFFSNGLMRALGSRKRLVISGALLQGFMYVPVALIYFFGELKIWHLLFFTCLYWTFGMVQSPAWNSWMGDLVVEGRLGAYFGRRSKVAGTATFIALLMAGYILQQFEGRGAGRQYEGFVLIFLMAIASRMASVLFLSKKYEPAYSVPPEAEFGFMKFLRHAEFKNYRLFVLFLGFMNFAVFLSAPFFTPYMLHDLHLGYLTFTMVNAAAIIAKVLSMPVWGRAADRFGARRVLTLAGFLMPPVPILWLVSNKVAWLIAIQIYSGFIWGGFEIAAISFIFDTTLPQKRATCVAYYNVISGLALISGAMLGSFIVRVNSVFPSKYLLVFFLSGLLRFVASLVFVPRLQEVRTVERIGYPRLFVKVLASMPTLGLMYELIPFQRRELEE
ncbi:MAG TPA: MFS transporter [Nitrospirota bacterium]|nr:MFS transporter [Nitrospirota bacterium]